MMRPLEGCQLQLSFADPANAFSALATSLQYQARALGMQIETAVRLDPEPEQADEILSISLSMPRQIGLALRPRTVCRIGFGADWANLAVSGAGGPLDPEHLAQASCGLMSVHGRASGKAQALGLPYVSTVCAALALQALMAAALAQLRGAGNRTCRVSMSGAALLCVGQYLAGATTQEAAERLLPGCNAIHERPPYVSCDGVWFELETLDAGPWRSFWLALGVDATSAAKGWQGFLLRYAKAIAPQPAVLMQTLAALPYAQIAAHAQQAGLAICPLRSLAQRASDADANALWQQGPWAFSGGAHLPAATLAALRAPGQDWHSDDLPLRGISVIESCRRIQGPLAGHLLALLGARVIRIEAPGGDPLRGMAPLADGISARFDALNRLKSVVEIDLKSTAGRAQVLQQAAGADVFLHNWAPGKAAQMQLDAPDLEKVNPALVYAYAGGWGSVENGLPGTDFMAQAWSGVASQIAAASGTPGGSLFTVLDVLGGIVAAQGVVAALLARHLYPCAVTLETSLLGAASLLCAGELERHFAEDACDAENHVAQQGTDTACPHALFDLADLGAAALDPGHPLFSYLEPGSYVRVRSPWSFQ